MADDTTARILAALEETRAALATQLARLDEKVVGVVARLAEDVSRLDGNLSRLDEKLDRTRADLMARMDRLQDAMTALRDDVTVNFGIADRVDSVAESARKETRALAEVVTAMQRQIARLQSDVRQLRGEP